MRKLAIVLVFTVLGCAKESPLEEFDVTQCPSGRWGEASAVIIFTAGGTVSFENLGCTTSGSYTCNQATQSLEMVFDASENSGPCQDIGTYSCEYEYTDDALFRDLLITCGGGGAGNLFSPTKTF